MIFLWFSLMWINCQPLNRIKWNFNLRNVSAYGLPGSNLVLIREAATENRVVTFIDWTMWQPKFYGCQVVYATTTCYSFHCPTKSLKYFSLLRRGRSKKSAIAKMKTSQSSRLLRDVRRSAKMKTSQSSRLLRDVWRSTKMKTSQSSRLLRDVRRSAKMKTSQSSRLLRDVRWSTKISKLKQDQTGTVVLGTHYRCTFKDI